MGLVQGRTRRFSRRSQGAVPLAGPCLLLVALLSLLLALLFAPQASAEVPRPPGAIDDRGYELVNPASKNFNSVLEAGAVSSADGNRVLYGLFGGTDIAPSGARPKLLATRTESGWVSKSPMPPRDQMLADSYTVAAFRPDLSSWIASAQDGLGSTDTSADVSLIRLDEDGHQELLHAFPVYFGASGVEAVASDDLTHVLADVPEPIDPSHLPQTANVYDFGSGAPVLVSRMPSTGRAPECGVLEQVEFANAFPGSASQNWVSREGSEAFFLSRGDDAPGCDDPLRLYDYDNKGSEAGSDDTTSLLSGVPLPGDPDLGVEAFLQATADGSAAFFRSATSYVPQDDADGNATDLDIYRASTATDLLTCITCVVPNAEVLPGVVAAAIAQDGSHVYFTSAKALTPGAPEGSEANPNIYVVSDGAIDYVATGGEYGVSDQPGLGGALTPDGSVLIFYSANPGLDGPSSSVNNGFAQYYRYDALEGSLTCVSCRSGGSTRGAPPVLAANNQAVPARIRVISDDGTRVFFPTNDALVGADVNGGRDIYEWHSGEVGLITGGVKQYAPFAQPTIYTTTASGRDLFFRDNAKLTPEVTDSAFQIYDARIDGGFPVPGPLAPQCSGEDCQGPPAPVPILRAPFSAVGEVPGKPKRKRHRHKRHRKHRAQKGKRQSIEKRWSVTGSRDNR